MVTCQKVFYPKKSPDIRAFCLLLGNKHLKRKRALKLLKIQLLYNNRWQCQCLIYPNISLWDRLSAPQCSVL